MTGRSASARRGQPILALAAILAIWAGARWLLWDPVFVSVTERALAVQVPTVPERIPPAHRLEAALIRPAQASLPMLAAPSDRAGPLRKISVGAGEADVALQPISSFFLTAPPTQVHQAKAHARDFALPPDKPHHADLRWTMDSWVLLRAGTGAVAQAPGAASYGGSQAGAVLRFRSGGVAADGYAYVRTSAAIKAPGGDRELAAGIGLRPKRAVPLRLLAEARLQDSGVGPAHIRPVASVVTELPWQELPAGFRGEAYGQAGYAAGRDATAFFDAQALVDRAVVQGRGMPEARVGAGLWAGGQKGAARIDVGPRVSIPLHLGGPAAARIAVDWRFRVGGNARPPSGPALTIATSF